MKTLNESEVSVTTLESLFRSAFISCSIDRDGDLRIEDSGVKVFIRVNSENKIIVFFSVWRLKSGGLFGEAKKLAFVNKLNDQYRLVRFSMPKPDRLWCDYQLLYEGGINAYQIINTYRLFNKVCKGMAADDPDDLID